LILPAIALDYFPTVTAPRQGPREPFFRVFSIRLSAARSSGDVSLMSRPEFSRNVRTCFNPDSYAGRCRAATGMHCCLRKRARSRMSGKPARGNLMFARLGIARDHCTRQRMPQPRTKPALGRPLVVQVFMQRSSDRMVNGGANGVSRKPRAYALAESGCAASVILWMTGHLTESSAADNSTHSALANRRSLPIAAIRMLFLVRGNAAVSRHRHDCR